ncbi:MAG TPA: NAD(P)/FAD-dependent oxidoreductase [Myxococcaceae bacterium]|nr:NAD(P)/FAD-dependent oxidoreductase [Myxococcaceae bacterium]
MAEELVDVVVVGAGAAGLAAAEVLARARLGVRVLEARPHIGGRVDTRSLPGWPVPVELGAEFVQGKARSLLTRARKAGLRVRPTGQRHLTLQDGRLVDAGPALEKALAQVATLHGDVPVEEVLEAWLRSGQLAPDGAALARNYVEGYYAADVTRASAEAIGALERASRALHGDEAARIQGGFLGVLEHILASVLRRVPGALRLSTVVNEIRWSAGRVVVESRKSGGYSLPELRARAIIVTVPLGVLRAPAGSTAAIRFAPRVHDVERAAGALVDGPLFKLLLRFREDFWSSGHRSRLRGFGFAHLPGGAVPTWWTTAPVDSGVLTGWAGGPLAQELSVLAPEARRARALDSLQRLFGTPRSTLEELLEDEAHHDWQADPYARGGYAVTPVGALGAARVLARPVAETLFFAGEHTHTGGQAGTVHGALETGERAARECIDALRARPRAR